MKMSIYDIILAHTTYVFIIYIIVIFLWKIYFILMGTVVVELW